MDILELLENLTVEPHQQAIIDAAVDEIERLREENERLQKTLQTVKHYLVYLDGTIKRTLGEKE